MHALFHLGIVKKWVPKLHKRGQAIRFTYVHVYSNFNYVCVPQNIVCASIILLYKMLLTVGLNIQKYIEFYQKIRIKGQTHFHENKSASIKYC